MRQLATCLLSVFLAALANGRPLRAQEEYQLSLRQLTTDPATDYYPSWSPDGKHIVFSSGRRGGHLWRVPADGGEPVQVTSDNANHPSWSPEGSFVAFDSDGGSQLMIISPNGGMPVRITPDSVTITRSAYPCWSPDGRKVAFTAQGAIWAIDLPTGESSLIFGREGHYARVFSWSADGSFLTADMDASETKREDDVWLLPTDGSEPRRLTDSPVAPIKKIPPPSRSERKAMSSPSGENAGCLSSAGESSVRLITRSPPTRFK